MRMKTKKRMKMMMTTMMMTTMMIMMTTMIMTLFIKSVYYIYDSSIIYGIFSKFFFGEPFIQRTLTGRSDLERRLICIVYDAIDCLICHYYHKQQRSRKFQTPTTNSVFFSLLDSVLILRHNRRIQNSKREFFNRPGHCVRDVYRNKHQQY